MVHHIQGAIEYNASKKQDKKIIAFYIVPETFSGIKEIVNKELFATLLDKESVKITEAEKE